MELCGYCYGEGFCRNLTARLVTDAELANPDFVRDLRAHAAALAIPYHRWRGFVTATYRDYPGTILDQAGEAVKFDLACCDDPNLDYWFRDTFCVPCPPGVTPRVRCEARERFRIVGTLLRAIDPVAGSLWGVRAANDESPPPRPAPLAKLAPECPYPRLLVDERWQARRLRQFQRQSNA